MAKVDLYPDFREFLKSLNSIGARYLVIGGYSVIHYGYERSTADLDVWIAADHENLQKVSSALQSFGGFSAKSVSPKVLNNPNSIFKFGRNPVRVDLVTQPDGVDFDDCYASRSEAIWDGIKVSVISLEDLKRNKRASGRAKDLADLEGLPAKPSIKKPSRRKRKHDR